MMFRKMRRFKQQISEEEWALNIKSVIAFGRISLVEDEEVAKRICTHLVGRFTDNQEYLEKE